MTHTDDTWGPWIMWAQGPRPVPSTTIVELDMGDGDILGPFTADGADWDFAGDPIIRYRIRKPRGMAVLDAVMADLTVRIVEGVE